MPLPGEMNFEILVMLDGPVTAHAALYADLFDDVLDPRIDLMQRLATDPFASVLYTDPNGYGVDVGISNLLAAHQFQRDDMTDILWLFTDTPVNAARRYLAIQQTITAHATLRFARIRPSDEQGDD